MMTSTPVAAYTPVLYAPNGYGRFRTYPRQVQTPIPGAGFTNVKRLVWGEQLLDLDGVTRKNRGPFRYGVYPAVPLLGVAEDMLGSSLILGAALVAASEWMRRTRPAAVAANRKARLRRRR